LRKSLSGTELSLVEVVGNEFDLPLVVALTSFSGVSVSSGEILTGVMFPCNSVVPFIIWESKVSYEYVTLFCILE